MADIGIRRNGVQNGIAVECRIILCFRNVGIQLFGNSLCRQDALDTFVHDGLVDHFNRLGSFGAAGLTLRRPCGLFPGEGKGNAKFLCIADAAIALKRAHREHQLVGNSLSKACASTDNEAVQIMDADLQRHLLTVGIETGARHGNRLVEGQRQLFSCKHAGCQIGASDGHSFLCHRLQMDHHRHGMLAGGSAREIIGRQVVLAQTI